MLYSTTPRPARFEGAIFGVGSSRAVHERLWRDDEPSLEIGNYRYTTGSGKNKTTHHWSYLALRLAGYPNVRNYLGSWKEWGDRTDLPVTVP